MEHVSENLEQCEQADVESARERGAAMVEYALLITFIAIVAVVAVSLIGDNVSADFSVMNSGFSN